MTDKLTVETAWLRSAVDALLEHVEQTVGPAIEFDRDMFWSLHAPDKYDLSHAPTVETVGSVTQSVAALESVLENRDETISYGLVWLADILDALGRQIVQ